MKLKVSVKVSAIRCVCQINFMKRIIEKKKVTEYRKIILYVCEKCRFSTYNIDASVAHQDKHDTLDCIANKHSQDLFNWYTTDNGMMFSVSCSCGNNRREYVLDEIPHYKKVSKSEYFKSTTRMNAYDNCVKEIFNAIKKYHDISNSSPD